MDSPLITHIHTFNTKRKSENIASRKIIQNRHQQTEIWKINRTFPEIYIHKYIPFGLCWWWTLCRSVRYASLWFPIWFLSSNTRLAMECCRKRGLGRWLFCSGKHQSSNWTKMNVTIVSCKCLRAVYVGCGWFDILLIAYCGRGCNVLCIHGV